MRHLKCILLITFGIALIQFTHAQLKVNSIGDLGLGTSSPQNWFSGRLFDMYGNRPILKFTTTSSAGLSTICFRTSNMSSSGVGNGEFNINYMNFPSDPGTSYVNFWAYPGGNVLTVLANGKVGVGYISPSYPLHVNGIVCAYNINPSDERLKQDIKDLNSSISQIKKLKGVSYRLKMPDEKNVKNSLVSAKEGTDTATLKNYNTSLDTALYNRNHIGFLAQEVQKVFPELVYTDNNGMLSVDYISLIPVLAEAMKEQQVQIDDLQAKINKLEKKNVLTKSEPANGASHDAALNSTLPDMEAAALYQNIPNPFSISTEIKYFLPLDTKQAVLYLYNMQGNQIKSFIIEQIGNGSITINANELKAGMYFYTLIADGIEVDTKKMILTD